MKTTTCQNLEQTYCCKKIWYDQYKDNRNQQELLERKGEGEGEDQKAEEEEDGTFKPLEFTNEERIIMLNALWGNKSSQQLKDMLRIYLIHMALSNTVKPYEKDGTLKYQAESAEELAMVLWAKSMGFTKIKNNPTMLEIQHKDELLNNTFIETISYNHLATCGFSSKRARVSVLYQNIETKQIHFMIKGQDTTVLPLLNNIQDIKNNLELNLNNMCSNGLRTLVCGYNILDSSFWNETRQKDWLQILNASPSIENKKFK